MIAGATYVGHTRSSKKENTEKRKWQIPWVICVRNGCQSRSEDASGRQRVSALGAVNERTSRGEGVEQSHS